VNGANLIHKREMPRKKVALNELYQKIERFEEGEERTQE
jgi:hypothetical protein